MNNAKWTWAAIGYMCGFAYGASLMVYQLGGLLSRLNTRKELAEAAVKVMAILAVRSPG